MGENKSRYLMKVAIDFGSTNTVMAWRVYEAAEDGTWTVSEKFNALETVKRIPSIMIFKEDNPDSEAVKEDVCGEQAVALIRGCNTPPVARDNFKQGLYTASGSPDYLRSVELTQRFFSFLREIYRREVYNPLPAYVIQELRVVLYLSTPVRANPTHRTLMRDIAQRAGFGSDNGIDEINTDYDEARCVVRYAMENAKEQLQGILEKAGQPGGAMLVFIDVGGSTMDVSLENLTIGLDGTETMDSVSYWPNADVEYPLGGCLVDEAMKDYLIGQGFADRDYLQGKWEHGDAKFRFRSFKEENNKRLAQNGVIEKLGQLASVCYDYDEEIFPEHNYAKSAGRIDREIFEGVICKDYIQNMSCAMRDLFRRQRPREGCPRVLPEDVDAVFLAGDGSRLYFIQELMRSGRMGFDWDRCRMFASWKNPSLCCALGALVEQERLITPNYAKDQYQMQLCIYAHHSSLASYIAKNPLELTPSWPGLVNENGIQLPCNCIFQKTYPLVEKYQMFPVTGTIESAHSYLDTGSDNLCIQLTLFRVDDAGGLEMMGMPYVKSRGRKLGDSLQQIVRGFVGGTVALPVIMLGVLQKKMRSANQEQKDTVVDKWAQFIVPKREASMQIQYGYRMEPSRFQAELIIKSTFFDMTDRAFRMEL